MMLQQSGIFEYIHCFSAYPWYTLRTDLYDIESKWNTRAVLRWPFCLCDWRFCYALWFSNHMKNSSDMNFGWYTGFPSSCFFFELVLLLLYDWNNENMHFCSVRNAYLQEGCSCFRMLSVLSKKEISFSLFTQYCILHQWKSSNLHMLLLHVQLEQKIFVAGI